MDRARLFTRAPSQKGALITEILLIAVLLCFAALLPFNATLGAALLGGTVLLLLLAYLPAAAAPTALCLIAILYTDDIPFLPSAINILKTFVLVGVAAYIVLYGIKTHITYLPVYTYILLALFSAVFAAKPEGYTLNDLLTAFAGYILGWIIFYTNWHDVRRMLKNIMLLPPVSLGLGVVYSIFHIRNVIYVDYLGSMRLQGSTISPYLAMLGMIGMVSAITLFYHRDETRKKLYLFMTFADYFIILATLTRGAIIGSSLILLAFVLKYVHDLRRSSGYISFGVAAGLFFLILAAAVFTVLAIYRTFTGTGDDSLNSSGRLGAWTEYLRISSVSRTFGMGLGSLKNLKGANGVGTVFVAAHNEFVRFIVETGVVGLICILINFIVMFAFVARNNLLGEARLIYPFLIIAFVIFSFTDNTIAAPQFWYIFCWYLGLICQPKKPSVPALRAARGRKRPNV